ncbi:glycosyltransferase family 4 protein [Kroppenstedtia pulmonis]|uniref:Glycosyltransferase family 4 protein n=1 Tax=Kroppenstedtia pulmonis TaxID=1380685 RepID=A0A7D3Y6M6_9BACL|nr:glycosyltransferase family 4 protein [Kroppenstedtia pulmonis]QKG85685.1 glycosyltransferase family 4 protein [Kroppenstedtia pulmonis]
MKVMIFSSVHSCSDSRIFHKQAVSLARAGYEVEVHALANFKENENQGVRLVGLPVPRNKWQRLRNGWILYRRALVSEADRFHFHDPELLPWGVLLRQRTNRPVIYDAHEDLPKQIHTKPWIPKLFRPFLARLAHQVEKALARRLSAVVTATESIADQFDAPQVAVVKNYPLTAPYTHTESDDDKNRLLYVGGISYLRGYQEMIRMMDYLPHSLQAELHLIGPMQHIRSEDRKLDQLKEKRVYYHGIIPFEEVPQWLSRGKVGLVCLHPVENYQESLPIKLFEYMAMGLPVVATDFPLWRKIVADHGAGRMVNPLDPSDMAEKVKEILSDPLLQRKMGEQGRKAYQEKYNWQVEEKKLIRLYQGLSE